MAFVEGTKRAAQLEKARLIASITRGDYAEPSKLTVGAFLDSWLDHVSTRVAPRTHERYAEIARKNLAPLLGQATLTKLRPDQIAAAYAKALKSGRRTGGGLSPRTVHHMHRILKQALALAVKWGVLTKNPAASVDPPKVERISMKALDAAQTAHLLAHFRPTRMYVPVLLAVLCGLRRGEVAALTWRAVNLERGQMAVAASAEQTKAGVRIKETKSGRARTAIDELRRHRLHAAEEPLRLGAKVGPDTPVVAQEDGSPLQSNSLTHEFVRILGKSKTLPTIRFHDLRHTHATHLLAAGVHPKIAQERLGHSTIGVTLDLYSHVMPGMQEDAAAKVDAALRLAIEAAGKSIG